MKINVYCNDYFMAYNQAQPNQNIKNLRTGFIKGIYNKDDLFILRGEPTLHYDFSDVLDTFKNKNYILTTHGNDIEKITSYEKSIPYISFNWDGFANDIIKGYKPLTSNIMKALQFLQSKNTTTRIAYTISPYNIKWLQADLIIMRKMMDSFPNMKQPYFMLYQQGTYYSQENFAWTNLTSENIDMINKSGLLTEKNKNYLFGWFKQKEYNCVSPRNELVIMPDASVRLCQSIRMNEVVGNLNDMNLQQIIEHTEDVRSSTINCQHKSTCWFACNYKDNINGAES